MRSFIPVIAIALAAGCTRTADNESFDPWCGDELCTWHLERGAVSSVPTWTSSDLGIDFVGSDVAIDLDAPFAFYGSGSNAASCIVFTVTADIAADADVNLNLDANADGTIDFTQHIPTSSWAPVSLETTVDGWFQGMRFELTKTGSGHVVLADLQANLVASCGDYVPSFAAPAPLLGAACGSAGCEAGATCVADGGGYSDLTHLKTLGSEPSQICVGCGSDADCGSGEVCGAGPAHSPTLAIPMECVPAGQTPLGEACATGRQCDTGLCQLAYPSALGMCTGCMSNADCGAGTVCGSGSDNNFYVPPEPRVCHPTLGASGSGAWCLTGSDCASGTCNGTVTSLCEYDFRTCTSDEECPFIEIMNDPFLFDHELCMPDQIVGGTCQ